MKDSILYNKAKKFALRIIKMHDYLKNTKHEYVMSHQICKSGTSIGANIAEGCGAQSIADFIAKYSVSQKECYETIYWLDLLHESCYIDEDVYQSMNNDAVEIQKMLTSSLKTAKNRLKKEDSA